MGLEAEAVKAKERASLTLLQELELEEATRKVEAEAKSRGKKAKAKATPAKEAAKSRAERARQAAERKEAEEDERERQAAEERRQLDAARCGDQCFGCGLSFCVRNACAACQAMLGHLHNFCSTVSQACMANTLWCAR